MAAPRCDGSRGKGLPAHRPGHSATAVRARRDHREKPPVQPVLRSCPRCLCAHLRRYGDLGDRRGEPGDVRPVRPADRVGRALGARRRRGDHGELRILGPLPLHRRPPRRLVRHRLDHEPGPAVRRDRQRRSRPGQGRRGPQDLRREPRPHGRAHRRDPGEGRRRVRQPLDHAAAVRHRPREDRARAGRTADPTADDRRASHRVLRRLDHPGRDGALSGARQRLRRRHQELPAPRRRGVRRGHEPGRLRQAGHPAARPRQRRHRGRVLRLGPGRLPGRTFRPGRRRGQLRHERRVVLERRVHPGVPRLPQQDQGGRPGEPDRCPPPLQRHARSGHQGRGRRREGPEDRVRRYHRMAGAGRLQRQHASQRQGPPGRRRQADRGPRTPHRLALHAPGGHGRREAVATRYGRCHLLGHHADDDLQRAGPARCARQAADPPGRRRGRRHDRPRGPHVVPALHRWRALGLRRAAHVDVPAGGRRWPDRLDPSA